MFITAIIWKLFLFVLKNCIHCVKNGNVVQLSFHVGASSYSPNRSTEEKVELVCLGFFFFVQYKQLILMGLAGVTFWTGLFSLCSIMYS